MSRVQFEREFEIYSDLWAAIVELREAALSLRPMVGLPAKRRRGSREDEARPPEHLCGGFEIAAKIAEKRRPFYAESVYRLVTDLRQLVKREVIEYEANEGPGNTKYLGASDA